MTTDRLPRLARRARAVAFMQGAMVIAAFVSLSVFLPWILILIWAPLLLLLAWQALHWSRVGEAATALAADEPEALDRLLASLRQAAWFEVLFVAFVIVLALVLGLGASRLVL